jgi:BirA family biotin operon repressor/biotin-[acetyl-CoA-carboxylase] ligase
MMKELLIYGIAVNGSVITSVTQSDGKGRLGRKWESPEGGLWMSVLLEMGADFDTSKLGLISLMAGGSVATAIIMEYELDAGLKWPNDVLIDGRKVSGILAELVDFEEKRFVILGIGINVNNRIAGSYEFSDCSTSIAEEFKKNVKIDVLENTILEELDFRMGQLKNQEYGLILDDWRNLSETLGRHVKAITPGGEYNGLAKDIDENGSLILDMDGRIETILAGDCRHLD